MDDPAARLALIRPAVPVDLGEAVLVESWSNDTWITGRSVLRVCWRGDTERLLREQALLASLPALTASGAWPSWRTGPGCGLPDKRPQARKTSTRPRPLTPRAGR